MYIILQRRITNGKMVFDIDKAKDLATAVSMAKEFVEWIGKLDEFVYPTGRANSYKQGYVNGNHKDIYRLDILDSDFWKVDEQGNVSCRERSAY